MMRDPQWRRSVLALALVGGGGLLIAVAAWLARAVLAPDWPLTLAAARLTLIGNALYAVLALIGVVLLSLGMSVALRQVSARVLGADFTASGEDRS